MVNGWSRVGAALLVLSLASSRPATSADENPLQAASSCASPRPAGALALDAGFRRVPIVDVGRPLNALPGPSLWAVVEDGSIDIRLDDLSLGKLHVERRPCSGDECQPNDCGCPAGTDSYFLKVTGPTGKLVAQWHLWAAYGLFQVVPMDLVDGPGDEVVAVRVAQHSSPPTAQDLKIWKISGSTVNDLAPAVDVESLLNTIPIGCARWRDTLSVDLHGVKPRVIELQPSVGVIPECCTIDTTEGDAAGVLKIRHLIYDQTARRYVLR